MEDAICYCTWLYYNYYYYHYHYSLIFQEHVIFYIPLYYIIQIISGSLPRWEPGSILSVVVDGLGTGTMGFSLVCRGSGMF